MNNEMAWKFPEQIKALYPELEALVMPMIRRKAAKVARRNAGIGLEDAIQEGRMALMRAMTQYDYNRAQGEFERYANVVLDNTYNGLIYRELAKARMPRVIANENGEWKTLPRAPLSLDDESYAFLAESIAAPPTPTERDPELEQRVAVMKMRMLNGLKTERDRQVFRCRTNPPLELWRMIENEGGDPTSPEPQQIARHLGLTKNAVDWSLHKIRELFLRLSRESFSDLYGNRVLDKSWAHIHTSPERSENDFEYVRKVIEQRRLDHKPLPDSSSRSDHCQKLGQYVRVIERYAWGVVLFIQNESERRTMVIEGKFNPLVGEAFGANGSHDRVRVPWYFRMAKQMGVAK